MTFTPWRRGFWKSGRSENPVNKEAVFFDRDGTINEEVGYLSRLDQLVLYPTAARAIRMVNEAGMMAVVVTNQSGVARGIFDEAFLEKVHRRLQQMLADSGARIDRFYYCPHHPAEGRVPYVLDCDCRKPNPGMILRAARELHIDLGRSYMIGDTFRDVSAARRAGVTGILVRTGYGARQSDSEDLRGDGPEPAYNARDILDAVSWILKDRSREHSYR
jgi:histidinol-phosphate phosphatase family protein